MSDFWQAPLNGPIINLDHIVTIDKVNGLMRVTTVNQSVTLTMESDPANALLLAINKRMIACDS